VGVGGSLRAGQCGWVQTVSPEAWKRKGVCEGKVARRPVSAAVQQRGTGDLGGADTPRVWQEAETKARLDIIAGEYGGCGISGRFG